MQKTIFFAGCHSSCPGTVCSYSVTEILSVHPCMHLMVPCFSFVVMFGGLKCFGKMQYACQMIVGQIGKLNGRCPTKI